MKHIPQFITGQSVFIDSVGLLGTLKQGALPKVEQLRETIKQGGFERSLSTGVFKAMESELTISEYHESVYKAMNSKTPTFVIKGSLKHGAKKIPVVATIKGEIDVDDGSWETTKEAERKIKIYADFYQLEVDGKIQVQMDVENMIALIDGVDHLAELRSHIL